MKDTESIKVDDQELNAILYMFNLKDQRDTYEENLYSRFVKIKEARIEIKLQEGNVNTAVDALEAI